MTLYLLDLVSCDFFYSKSQMGTKGNQIWEGRNSETQATEVMWIEEDNDIKAQEKLDFQLTRTGRTAAKIISRLGQTRIAIR